MKHIILLDPLEKLTVSKDSTLLFAKAIKDSGKDVLFLFSEDLSISNIDNTTELYLPTFKLDEGAISSIDLKPMTSAFSAGDILHMRLEPPFDSNYLRILWLLRFIQSKGIRVINDPAGIMNFQEKIYPMQSKNSTPTAVIRKFTQYKKFIRNFPEEKVFILKPLDLFQGFGVTKVNVGDFSEIKFLELLKSFGGVGIIQPFLKQVKQGEIRATYFAGEEIGSILKVPPEGSFLANIAQGAKYQKINLDNNIRKECKAFADQLNLVGVPWVAFDLLDGKISEANTTCPGLIYETSRAYGENLAHKIVDLL